MIPQLFTQRLLLDLITEDDHDFIFSLVNSKGWLQFIGDRNVRSIKDAVEYIKKVRSTRDLFYWVVRLNETNEPLGIISFLKRGYLEHFDIGFAFLPRYNGQGYAYEACEKVLSVVGKKPEYSTILATTIPQNVSSIRLLKKLGFQFDREYIVTNEILHIYSNKPAGFDNSNNRI